MIATVDGTKRTGLAERAVAFLGSDSFDELLDHLLASQLPFLPIPFGVYSKQRRNSVVSEIGTQSEL